MPEARITTRLDSRGFETGIGKMKGGISKLSAKLGSMKGLMAGAFSIGAIYSHDSYKRFPSGQSLILVER